MTWTPADSIRPERLWSTFDAQHFTVGRRWGLDPSTGEWRAFTDEEQARGWMSPPTGFVTVTAVDREAGTFTIQTSSDTSPHALDWLFKAGGKP